jgi:hypothetical protein
MIFPKCSLACIARSTARHAIAIFVREHREVRVHSTFRMRAEKSKCEAADTAASLVETGATRWN